MAMNADDSGVESDYSSDMTSITSSNYFHTHRGSRRYHGIVQNVYPLPNDAEEQERLDEQHTAMSTVLGGNIIPALKARLRNPRKILDVGTGSGRWAIEVAEEYPRAQVIGVDLSPMQPVEDVPQNCEFIIGDLTETLQDFDDCSFDVVHSRFIQSGVKATEWPKYLHEVHRILKPGGWAQICEPDIVPISESDSMPFDAPPARMLRTVREWGARNGLLLNGEHLERDVPAAGFTEVSVVKVKWDMGDWRGDERTAKAGRASQHAMAEGVLGAHEMVRHAFPDDAERERFLEEVNKGWMDPSYHIYLWLWTVVGRKPEQ